MRDPSWAERHGRAWNRFRSEPVSGFIASRSKKSLASSCKVHANSPVYGTSDRERLQRCNPFAAAENWLTNDIFRLNLETEQQPWIV